VTPFSQALHHHSQGHQSTEDKQAYFYQLMKLFQPWRLESDLCLPEKTFSQTFGTESNRLAEMVAYHNHSIQAEQQEEQMSDRES